MKDKYVVIANWDSCDSMVYGLFKSYKKACKWRDNYKWDDYDRNNELHLEVEKLQEVKQ